MKSKIKFICISILLVPFSIIGLIFLIAGTKDVLKAIQTYNWKSYEAKMITYEVRLDNNEGVIGHYFNPSYSFKIKNENYTGGRLGIGIGGVRDKNYHSIKDKLDIAKTIQVYVNPQNPKESVIIQGITFQVFFSVLLGLAFFLSGLIILFKIYNIEFNENKTQKKNSKFLKVMSICIISIWGLLFLYVTHLIPLTPLGDKIESIQLKSAKEIESFKRLIHK